jgi:N-acetylglucosamine kinase-like BadF-type ATPase
MGDRGSAYWLVVEALKAITGAEDGFKRPTALTDRFLRHLGLEHVQDLVALVYSRDRLRLAALAPLVLETAETDDPCARGIEGEATYALGATAVNTIYRLGLQGGPVPLALTGGVLLSSESYCEGLLERLAQWQIDPDPVTLVEEPAEGAVQLAMRLATKG